MVNDWNTKLSGFPFYVREIVYTWFLNLQNYDFNSLRKLGFQLL